MKKSDMQPSPDDRDNILDLELPDAPDFISERTQYPLHKALEFVEEMRAMFPMTDRQRAIREERRCTEEFVL